MQRVTFWVVIAAVAAAVPASAVDTGFFVGVGGGRSSLTLADFYPGEYLDLRFEDDEYGYKLFGGYRFSRYFAAEAAWVDPGSLKSRGLSTGYQEMQVRTTLDGIGAFAMGILPLGNFDLFAKLGVIDWDSTTTITLDDVTEVTDDGATDAAYGLGIALRAKSITLRLEGELFDIGLSNGVWLYTFGISYTF
jgi:OOP family OmpA-OmpF porin